MTTQNPTPQSNTNLSEPAAGGTPTPTTGTTVASTAVKTHGASEIPDSIFWTGHAFGLTLLIIATVWIFVAKGPTRKDAIKSLLDDANKKEANNSLT
jgi:hypothetical protein